MLIPAILKTYFFLHLYAQSLQRSAHTLLFSGSLIVSAPDLQSPFPAKAATCQKNYAYLLLAYCGHKMLNANFSADTNLYFGRSRLLVAYPMHITNCGSCSPCSSSIAIHDHLTDSCPLCRIDGVHGKYLPQPQCPRRHAQHGASSWLERVVQR